MSIFRENKKTSEELKKLLQKDLPTYREAFSDRTCYLMACLSELVYIKFNKPILDPSNKELARKVSKLLGEEKESSITKLLDLLSYDYSDNEKKLISELKEIGINRFTPICHENTQAIFVEMKDFYVLVFRGTEVDEISDIKTDMDCKLDDDGKGRAHSGFLKDYSEIEDKIIEVLSNIKDKPIMITGHSLGGALATVATKKLKGIKIAACYTFGSPRVGNEIWIEEIKIPIYRIVNSADPVTMLPFNTMLVDTLSVILKFLPYGRIGTTVLQKRFRGYIHVGYMRYLDDINPGEFENSKLLYSVSFLRRIKGFIVKSATVEKRSLFKMPTDHKMITYRKKLEKIAIRRNQ